MVSIWLLIEVEREPTSDISITQPRYTLKNQQGLDVPVHMLKTLVDNKTMDNRGYK